MTVPGDQPHVAVITIYATREGRMLPLTLPADRARSLAAAMEAHGFTVRLGSGPVQGGES
jgi:hypothetical protein